MIRLTNKETGAVLGEITEEQPRSLVGGLEEEDSSDSDYWIDADTLDFLREEGADEALLSLLASAIEGSEGAEISWSRV